MKGEGRQRVLGGMEGGKARILLRQVWHANRVRDNVREFNQISTSPTVLFLTSGRGRGEDRRGKEPITATKELLPFSSQMEIPQGQGTSVTPCTSTRI